jgi:MFS family permease
MSSPLDRVRRAPVAREPLIGRTFVLLVLGQLFQSLGYASLPLVPLYLDFIGASRTEIGAVMAAGSVGGLALRPLTGSLLDSHGRRPVLLVGTFLLAFGVGTVGFAQEPGLFLYLNRLLFGVGVGALFTGYFTAVSDVIPASRRTEGIAIFGIAGIVPLALNPVGKALATDADALRWVFACTGVAIACSVVFLWAIRDTPKSEDASGPPTAPGALLRALREPALRPVWVATLAFASQLAALFAFANVSAASRGVTQAGMLWAVYAATAVVLRVVGARLPDRIGPSNLMVPALGAYAGALLLLASATTLPAYLFAGFLGGFGHGYAFPVITAQVIGRSAPAVRGRALAVFTGLWDVALLTASPLCGLVADRFDDATMFVGSALVALALLGLWAVLEHRVDPNACAR